MSEPYPTPVPALASPLPSAPDLPEICSTTDYGKSLLQGLESLFKQQSLCDFTIKADGKEFLVHRVVIAACSDYFRALFSVNMLESRQDSVELHGVSASGLTPLVAYAYNGALSLSLRSVKDVLGVAYFLQMTSAIDLCVDFLTRKMDFHNSEAILEMADTYGIQSLKDHYRHLILENFFSFAETNSFLKLSATQLSEILENDSLRTTTESRLLKCAIRWYNHDPKSRERDAHRVFDKVRVTIDGWPTIEYAACLDVFKRNEECRKLVEFWVTYMTEAERRHLKQSPGTRVRSDRESFVLIGGECYQDVFGNFHWSHPLSNEIVGNSENRFYHKDLKTWQHLGCVGYMDPIAHFQFINVNDFGVFCGGYHYKYVDEIEDEDDGGNFDVPRLRRATNEARLFTPGPFGIWELASMRETRAEFALVALPSSSRPQHLLACGGVNEAGVLRNVERYSVQENRWEQTAPLPYAMHGMAGASADDAAWICGGKSGVKILDNLFRFDARRKRWTEKARMHHTRARHTLTEWNGQLYAAGGETERGALLSSVEVYNIELDQWSIIEPLVFETSQHSACVMDDRLFILGGQNSAAELMSVIEVYEDGIWKVQEEHLPKGIKNFGLISCTMKMPREGEEDDKDSVHQAYDARFPDSDEESFPGEGWETVDSDSEHSLDPPEWDRGGLGDGGEDWN